MDYVIRLRTNTIARRIQIVKTFYRRETDKIHIVTRNNMNF